MPSKKSLYFLLGAFLFSFFSYPITDYFDYSPVSVVEAFSLMGVLYLLDKS